MLGLHGRTKNRMGQININNRMKFDMHTKTRMGQINIMNIGIGQIDL